MPNTYPLDSRSRHIAVSKAPPLPFGGGTTAGGSWRPGIAGAKHPSTPIGAQPIAAILLKTGLVKSPRLGHLALGQERSIDRQNLLPQLNSRTNTACVNSREGNNN